jgi:hypothetical protein
VFRFPGPRFIPRGSAKLVVNFTESRTRGPCQHSRSGKSGSAPVLMNKPERVHTGEQIHFPHLAKNERDMAYPQLWLGESFNGCRLASEFARYDQVVATAGLSFPRN